MKLISWNVNGIRSVFKTTFLEWLKAEAPDVVCLQEIKADSNELPKEFSEIDGYYAYFNSSGVKKGHAGVAVYTKIKPLSVETKLGIEQFDDEGRCLKLVFKDFILFNFYIPNGGRDKHDIPYKLEVYKKLFQVFESISDKKVILTGDFNIAHTDLDVFHAKQNVDNTMFTPIEREQLTKLMSLGYVDTFRNKYPDKKEYTWWSYAYNARTNNIGWRIDYFFVTKSLVPLVQDAFTQHLTLGSDHGPCGLLLDIPAEYGDKPVYKKTEMQPTMF